MFRVSRCIDSCLIVIARPTWAAVETLCLFYIDCYYYYYYMIRYYYYYEGQSSCLRVLDSRVSSS